MQDNFSKTFREVLRDRVPTVTIDGTAYLPLAEVETVLEELAQNLNALEELRATLLDTRKALASIGKATGELEESIGNFKENKGER